LSNSWAGYPSSGLFSAANGDMTSHFDMDMAIACMLTNHHLESTELHDEDQEMLLRLRILRKQKKQQKDMDRKQSVRASKRNRKLRAELELGLEDV
jgi:hypothetical protein